MTLYWPELHQRELLAVLADLEKWVSWLRGIERRVDTMLPECWPRHPGVVLQLTAWQRWWWTIYAPSLNPGPVQGSQSGQAAIFWWESLDRARERLEQEFRGCKQGACWRRRDAEAPPVAEQARRQREATWEILAETPIEQWAAYFPARPEE